MEAAKASFLFFDLPGYQATYWLKSPVFTELWLDARALVRNDLAVAAANCGLAGPEHAEVVAKLNEKRGGQ